MAGVSVLLQECRPGATKCGADPVQRQHFHFWRIRSRYWRRDSARKPISLRSVEGRCETSLGVVLIEARTSYRRL